MALTDIQVKTAKPQEKDYKLTDGDGMYLLVAATGGKRWRLKYRFGGKEKLLALGTYPDISLQEARNKRHEARNLLAHNIDPGDTRKALKQAKQEREEIAENSFEIIAREWHGKFSGQWTSGHADTIMTRLERDVFPWLGAKPVSEVKPVDLLAVLRRVSGPYNLITRRYCANIIFEFSCPWSWL